MIWLTEVVPGLSLACSVAAFEAAPHERWCVLKATNLGYAGLLGRQLDATYRKLRMDYLAQIDLQIQKKDSLD